MTRLQFCSPAYVTIDCSSLTDTHNFHSRPLFAPDSQAVGRTNNGVCTGVGILVDPSEPPDADPSSAVRYLVKVPMAVIVRPEGEVGKTTPPSVRAALKDPFLRKLVPDGCVPVMPTEKQTTHKFERGKGVTIDGHHYFPGELIKIRRKAIPLAEGYSVTDFYKIGRAHV